MFKNLTVAWTVAAIAVVIALLSGVRTYGAQQRATAAERKLQGIERMAKASEQLEPAVFVRADQTTITYRKPHQVDRGGQIFVDYTEFTALYGDELEIFGPAVTEDGYPALSKIPEGKPISIGVTGGDGTSSSRIETLYVAP
jgi:hypothetical protein